MGDSRHFLGFCQDLGGGPQRNVTHADPKDTHVLGAGFTQVSAGLRLLIPGHWGPVVLKSAEEALGGPGGLPGG